MQDFWVYLLRCADGRFYAGHTDDLERRLGQHHSGTGSDFTARRRPVALVWSERVPSREEALAFELRIKGWTRAKKEALIGRDWDAIHHLAVSREARASTSLSTNDVTNEALDMELFVRSEGSAEQGRSIDGRASACPEP